MEKVLVYIDDSRDDLFLFQSACKVARARFRLVSLWGGTEALRYFDRTGQYTDRTQFPEPDLVLLDIKMPGIDGFEVLRRMKAHIAFAAIPVGMLTASDWPGDVQNARSLGATWFFQKPPEMKDLIEFARKMDVYMHDGTAGADAILRTSRFNAE